MTPTTLRDLPSVPTQRENDLLTVHRVLSALDREGQDAAAYNHASHGCPFTDSTLTCPVGCDETEAFI